MRRRFTIPIYHLIFVAAILAGWSSKQLKAGDVALLCILMIAVTSVKTIFNEFKDK